MPRLRPRSASPKQPHPLPACLPAAVETRSSGHDALELLRERQEHNHQFDLVLSDVYMPDMDGFKLLECIGLELDLPVISEHPAPTCPAGPACQLACPATARRMRPPAALGQLAHAGRKRW